MIRLWWNFIDRIFGLFVWVGKLEEVGILKLFEEWFSKIDDFICKMFFLDLSQL